MMHLNGWPCSVLQELQEWGAKMFGKQIQKHQDLNYIDLDEHFQETSMYDEPPTLRVPQDHTKVLVPFWFLKHPS